MAYSGDIYTYVADQNVLISLLQAGLIKRQTPPKALISLLQAFIR